MLHKRRVRKTLIGGMMLVSAAARIATSVARRPRVAARSAISGASWRVGRSEACGPSGTVSTGAPLVVLIPRRAVAHRRACASLVASFAAGVACRCWLLPPHAGVLIAIPSRCARALRRVRR